MTNVFFVHQIKHNKSAGSWSTGWDKGIVVKSDEGVDNLDAAKQGYHAYLGAYAYGHDSATDYVQCQVTNHLGQIVDGCSEIWIEQEPEEE